MKRFIGMLLVAVVILSSTMVLDIKAETLVSVNVEGKNIEFSDVKPFIDDNNRTLVPVRFVSEALGADVKWNGNLRQVTVTYNNKVIKLVIDQKTITVDNQTQEMDTKAILKESRTFVPLRFVSEAMGADVEWDGANRKVKITLKDDSTNNVKETNKIFLYGEQHAVDKILDKEIELWDDYYKNDNMRHLFVEFPYYTAELLNLWMKSDNDKIFNELFDDLKGTLCYNENVKSFYKKIKTNYPETIFHGTDIGHQYNTTGMRYLKYLEVEELYGTEQYKLTLENIEQGKYYYNHDDDEYRENAMVENFTREFNKISNEKIMGIYGSAHTTNVSNSNMTNQLKKNYPDSIYSEDISWLAKDIEPQKVVTLNINKKDYKALYFGKVDLTGFKNFVSRDIWRLENAYDDFKEKEKTGDILPASGYPMLIKDKQVLILEYTYTDGSTTRSIHRCDGNTWNKMLITEEIIID